MTADQWVVLATVVAMTLLIVRGRLSPPAAVVSATGFLFAVGVIDSDDALAGLANPAAMSVAGLYLVAGAISKADLIRPIIERLIGPGSASGQSSGFAGRASLGRLTIPAAASSAVMANTPIVAMLIPPVVQWCDARRVSASRFLLPLSYATILGGTLTVIGTSTNLVASGLSSDAGLGSFGLFETATISWPIVIVGLVVIVALGPSVLPPRRHPSGDADDDRPFTVVMHVAADSSLAGETVEAAGLRTLDGVYLVAIERASGRISPVAPDRRLDPGDRLVFVGDLERVVDLYRHDGLEIDHEGDRLEGVLHEVVIGPASPLLGRTIRDAGFRSRHHAAVVAVHRSGVPITGKLGEIEVRTGDSLLLVADREFSTDSSNARVDFLVCTRRGPIATRARRTRTSWFALAALALVVILPAFDIVSVLRSVTIAGGVLVVGQVIRPGDVFELIDLRIVAMIAGAFSLGRAVAVSGLADELASAILRITEGGGQYGAVLGVVLAAMLLTEVITNVAAVALVFPLALDVAAASDLDPKRMAIGVAVAASSSFLTPLGYQTNTMVWGPGRYRMSDYLRLGIPLWLIAWFGISWSVVS